MIGCQHLLNFQKVAAVAIHRVEGETRNMISVAVWVIKKKSIGNSFPLEELH